MNWLWESILISCLHTRFCLHGVSFLHSSLHIAFTVVLGREFVAKPVLITLQCFYYCWAMCAHVKGYSLPATICTMPPHQIGWKRWNFQGTQPGQLTQTDQYHMTSIPHGIILSSRIKERKMAECAWLPYLTSSVTVTYAETLPKTGSVSPCQHKALNICLCLYAQLYLTYLTVVISIPESLNFVLFYSTDREGSSWKSQNLKLQRYIFWSSKHWDVLLSSKKNFTTLHFFRGITQGGFYFSKKP